jgi:putative ABC transport system permease protein
MVRWHLFAQMAVEPEDYLAMYPEFLLPAEQKQAWLDTRAGAIVGRSTANRFGFKIGDKVPIQATFWVKENGSRSWEFDVVGIYDGTEKGTDTTQFLFRYDYFEEARAQGKGQVGWYMVRVQDPDRAAEIAKTIDNTFANSPYETKAETEKAFVQGFAKQVGNVGKIMIAVLSAVFFTILLVAGNTMAQSVRERIKEIGVLKSVGFTHGQVLMLVLVESGCLAGAGGMIGLGLAWLLISSGDPTGGALPIFYFPLDDLILGAVLVLALGLAAGIFPALQAQRLRIAEALRRT